MITLSSTILQNISEIQHGFFSRLGGHSKGEFSSLNCNIKSSDDISNIENNLAAVSRTFHTAISQIKILKQIHSNNIVVLSDRDISSYITTEADAIITTVPKVPIGVMTADCVPILLCDRKNKMIGAIHAGWRGALSGIIQNTITRMQQIGASNINAAIGPCIRSSSYEVDKVFYYNALNNAHNIKQFFTPSTKVEHYQFDLPGYCKMLLAELSISVDDLNVDTYQNDQLFFSYRRSCHTSKINIQCGTQISAIMIK